MADPLLDIQINDAEVRGMLRRLEGTEHDLTPLMQSIGVRLLASTKRRFDDSEDPQGVAWAPVLKRRDYNTGRQINPGSQGFRPLKHSGHLSRNIFYQAESDQVTIGTPVLYGQKHQEGDGVKERQFIGASDQDLQDITNITIHYLQGLVRRSGRA